MSATEATPAIATPPPAALDWERGQGLLPAIVQDADNGRVLMLGYMNQAALAQTLASGLVTFWSRSRGKLWTKGESSGNLLELQGITPDCDGDALVLRVEQVGGAACHTGKRNCFFRRIDRGRVEDVGRQVFDPAEVYKK